MRRIIPIIRQWWCRQWIRKDEFDKTLELDIDYYSDIKKELDYWKRQNIFYKVDLNKNPNYYREFVNNTYINEKIDYWTKKLKWYEHDLAIRRSIAHEIDMKSMESVKYQIE